MPLILSGTGTIATSGGTAISIDNNARVSTPLQPYAIVKFQSGDYGAYNNMMANNFARPTYIVSNAFNCYDPSSGRFTAPVAGLYKFAFSTNMYMASAPAWFAPATFKNGSNYVYHYGDRFTAGWQYFCMSDTVPLSAGDYLQLYYATPSQTIGSDLTTYSQVSFVFLG